MDLAALIVLVAKASIILIVFSLGLKATFEDVTYMLKQPGELVRSLLALNVIIPLVAAMLVAAFDLDPAVKIALVALAVSPVPPVLPGKQLKAGRSQSYVLGLLVTEAVLAIVLVPVTLALIGAALGREVRVAPGVVARIVLTTVLAPIAAGLVVRRLAPSLAERIEPALSRLGSILLLVAVVPIVVVAWPAISSLIGNGTLVALAVLALAGLGVGHVLGGPDEDDRTALALAGASRHPGVAIAIAAAMFPGVKLAPAAILLYLLVSAVVAAPYVASRRQRHATPPAALRG
jgi:BASS family bile acid:Na+ symporter